MRQIWVAAAALAALFLTAGASYGQSAPAAPVAPVVPAKSGMVSYIEGDVYLDGKRIQDPIVAQYPYVNDNGVLKTVEGRAEVFMNPGLAVHMGENSSLRMITNRFIDTRVELVAGAAVATLPETDKDNSFTMAVKDAQVTREKAGVYHFYAEPARLKVFAGLAKAQIGDHTIEVPAGKTLDLSGPNAVAEKFDKDATDALDRWSGRRGELLAAANASSARDCNSMSYSLVERRSDPCAGSWRWNPWYGLYTYVMYGTRWCDPIWGYCYYNPASAMRAYYQPRPVIQTPYGGGVTPSQYPTASPTESGYSGAMAASSTAMSAPSAGTGSSAAAASTSSSVGHGAATSGGHGK